MCSLKFCGIFTTLLSFLHSQSQALSFTGWGHFWHIQKSGGIVVSSIYNWNENFSHLALCKSEAKDGRNQMSNPLQAPLNRLKQFPKFFQTDCIFLKVIFNSDDHMQY